MLQNTIIHIDNGTCASINYSDTCCPPGANCKAADGDCYCNAKCHELSDCCRDVYCPPRMLKLISNQFKLFNYFTINFTDPRTCVEVGITACCNDETNTGLCRVNFRDSQGTHCSCNASCHRRNDCCEDAVEIGCPHRKLIHAGMHKH